MAFKLTQSLTDIINLVYRKKTYKMKKNKNENKNISLEIEQKTIWKGENPEM